VRLAGEDWVGREATEGLIIYPRLVVGGVRGAMGPTGPGEARSARPGERTAE